jgi:LPS O-antigen subunit length determinant protein (WzzB/FepE family)
MSEEMQKFYKEEVKPSVFDMRAYVTSFWQEKMPILG